MSIGAIGGSNSIESLIQQYMAIERRPITQLESRKSELNIRKGMFSDLKTKLDTLMKAAKVLTEIGALSVFNTKSVVSGDPKIITASADTTAPRSAYSILVNSLAKAHRIQSDRQASAMVSTGFTGTINVQGVAIEITSSNNSLIGIRDAINSAKYGPGQGVVASVVDNRLVIQAQNTGTANRISMFDVSGNVLSGLGMVVGAPVERAIHAVNASSAAPGFEAGKVADGIGGDANAWHSEAAPSAANPQWIEVDLGSAQQVSRLVWGRDEAEGSTAGVPKDYSIEVSTDGVTWTTVKTVSGLSLDAGDDRSDSFAPVTARYVRLTVTATNDDTAVAIDELKVFDDSALYGANELQAPADNEFTIDGITVSRGSNTGITDVLPGVTLNLLATTETPVSLSVNPNAVAIQEKVEAFVKALNDVAEYIKGKSMVDSSTYFRGQLAGEYMYTSLRLDLLRVATQRVTPLQSGDPAYLEDIGITFDDNLSVKLTDVSKLTEALNRDPEAVARLFADPDRGIAKQMIDRIEPYVASSGYIDDDIAGVTSDIANIDTRIKRMEESLKLREQQLYRELTQLQQMLSSLIAQQNGLTGFWNYSSRMY